MNWILNITSSTPVDRGPFYDDFRIQPTNMMRAELIVAEALELFCVG